MDENLRNICQLILNTDTKVKNLKLQKLLYFIQAIYMIKHNKPAFENSIEAWPYGPVVPDAYFAYKRNALSANDNTSMTSELKEIIKEVVTYFSSWDEFEMVDLTHRYDTWSNKFSDPFAEKIITPIEILNFHNEYKKNNGSYF